MRRLTALAAVFVCAALGTPALAQAADPLADPTATPAEEAPPAPAGAAQITDEHGMPTGFYFALGIGGGVVTESERGTAFKPRGGCVESNPYGMWSEPDVACVSAGSADRQAVYEDVVNTEFGGGLGIQLKLGYNILGFVSLEAAVGGAGNPDASSGLGSVAFQLHWHIANHIMPYTERKWDFDVYGGFGYAIGGYHENRTEPDGSDEGKGWEGMAGTVGGAFNYALSKRITMGVDLKAVLPIWKTWIANFDKDYRREPKDAPSHAVFMPTLMFTFFLE